MLECESLDMVFALAEQKVTEGLIKKKMVAKNAYYGTGKVPDGGMFPLKSGTRIKGYKLGRIGIPDCTGWRPVEDELCETNACSFEPDVIQHGHSDYFFSLVQKDLRTDWICIDSVALRQMGEDEIMHLEEGLQNASRYVHEEFRRSRFIGMSQHKIVAFVPRAEGGDPVEEADGCDNEMLDHAFVFETRTNGEMDECHIRVAVDPDDIDLISELSLDMLDYASERLEYDDEVYMGDTGLLDVLLPDKRISNKLALQEASLIGGTGIESGVSMDLRQTYGTDRVLRNYGFRTDMHAMRFYPDTAFNADLDPFNLADPTTWPRFVRVFAYIPVKSAVAGVEFVTNPQFLRAPFGITSILNSRVMSVMSFPNVVNVAGARKVGGFGYEGTVQWQNPDWPCNVNRDKGFWKLRFRLAAKQNRDDEGYVFFHRLDRRRKLVGNPCPLPVLECIEEVSPYCFSGIGGPADPGTGENRAIDESTVI